MLNLNLRFNEINSSGSEINKVIPEFHKKGYILLRNVFVKESVSGFNLQLEDVMFCNEFEYAILYYSPYFIEATLVSKSKKILPFASPTPRSIKYYEIELTQSDLLKKINFQKFN